MEEMELGWILELSLFGLNYEIVISRNQQIFLKVI